jgi:predicted CXXCH cytochrome family protein
LGSVLVYYDQTTKVSGAKTFAVTGTNVTSGKLVIGSRAFIDPTAMSSNHPVGVVRPADATGYTSFKATPTGDANGVDYDASGNVQCQSCHNPHLYSTIEAPFLRKTTAGSALCLTCHDL